MEKTESQARFDLFLAYLEGKSPLSPELNSRLENGPFLTDKQESGWGVDIIDQFDAGDRQLCLKVINSGIFRRGELKASVNPGKVLPVENLEGFIGELALVIKRAILITKDSLLNRPLFVQNQARADCFKKLNDIESCFDSMRQWNLANINKIKAAEQLINELIESIKQEPQLKQVMLKENDRTTKKYGDVIAGFITVFDKYVPMLGKAPKAKRIEELLNFLNPSKDNHTSKIIKRLQRHRG